MKKESAKRGYVTENKIFEKVDEILSKKGYRDIDAGDRVKYFESILSKHPKLLPDGIKKEMYDFMSHWYLLKFEDVHEFGIKQAGNPREISYLSKAVEYAGRAERFPGRIYRAFEVAENELVRCDRMGNLYEGYSEDKETLARIKNRLGGDGLLEKKDLTSHLSATTALIGLVGGAFFFSTSVTGNVIGLSNGTSSVIGAVLLVIGFVAGYFWARSRKKRRK